MSNTGDFLFKIFADAYTRETFDTGAYNCYVSRVFPRENLFEISDSSYSVKCAFKLEGIASLKKALAEFSKDLNLLEIVGKKL